MCDTRFIEQQDSLNVFIELCERVYVSLAEISEENTKLISTKAELCIASIERSEFRISLFVSEKLFSLTLPSSILLEDKSLDLISATRRAKAVIKSLQEMMNDAENVFYSVTFLKLLQICR